MPRPLTLLSAGLLCAGVLLAQPLPKTIPAPPENPTTPAKVLLGRELFFDPILSGDGSLSCASCHDPEMAFADGKAVAEGLGGEKLSRNTPTVLNIGLFDSFFWDGRAASLEEQALAPLLNEQEMAKDPEAAAAELAESERYIELFDRAFGTAPSPQGIARALAAFQRTLLDSGSPFDRFLAGEREALSDLAREGWDLFRSNGCIRCHDGPLLSDGKFYRLSSAGSDMGREAITGDPADRYRFRTPTLRNVAETAPYFHDGSAPTLFDAVSFYFRRTTSPAGLEPDFQPLAAQSFSEIDAIVEFLRALSGDSSSANVVGEASKVVDKRRPATPNGRAPRDRPVLGGAPSVDVVRPEPRRLRLGNSLFQ